MSTPRAWQSRNLRGPVECDPESRAVVTRDKKDLSETGGIIHFTNKCLHVALRVGSWHVAKKKKKLKEVRNQKKLERCVGLSVCCHLNLTKNISLGCRRSYLQIKN